MAAQIEEIRPARWLVYLNKAVSRLRLHINPGAMQRFIVYRPFELPLLLGVLIAVCIVPARDAALMQLRFASARNIHCPYIAALGLGSPRTLDWMMAILVQFGCQPGEYSMWRIGVRDAAPLQSGARDECGRLNNVLACVPLLARR